MLAFNINLLKQYLGKPITFTDHDELLKLLFEYICDDVEKFIGFDLSETTYTNEIHILPNFQRSFETKAFPIIVPESGDAITMTIHENSIDADDFVYDLKGNIFFKSTVNINYGYMENHILLTYDAGFETFPYSAEMAIYKLVKRKYEERGGNIKSISDGSLTETRQDLIGHYPPDVYHILNAYRRTVY